MKLYIANRNYSSWSLRPWVLMKTLGIGFEEVLVPFVGGGPQAAFQEFSPTGKVPCLVDDAGRTVWDSLAIVEALAEDHPAVWPTDRTARTWARSASAEMHSGFGALRNGCSMSCGQRVQLTDPPAALTRDWARIDALWCQGLDRFGGPFLAGEGFTAVDAFYAPVVFRALTYSPQLSGAASGYLQRMLDLPAMVEWYRAALAEPWRDEDHERDVAAAGRIIADERAIL
jgi:glutathione S-transferase